MTSSGAFTVVVAVAELLAAMESVVAELALAVFEITVPSVTEVLTLTTTVKVAVEPVVSVVAEQEIMPVPPVAGVVQLQPAGGAEIDPKVV